MPLSPALNVCVADTMVPIDDGRLTVTASFGVCALTDAHTDFEGWLTGADQALYSAKASGRNRTISAHGPRVAMPSAPV